MPTRTLMIKWAYGTEYIDLENIEHGNVAIKDIVETREYWPTMNIFVTYRARVIIFNIVRNVTTIALEYKMDAQIDPNVMNVDNGAAMGRSTIRINSNTNTASATWRGERDRTVYGHVRALLIGEQPPYKNLRRTASVIVKLRPKQREMREQLRYFDNEQCVITGETEIAALEAAHVVPVHAGGEEVAENAILLRADLHLLFDAGLFWFEVKDDQATVVTSDKLSPKYRDLLNGRILNKDAFGRVRKALKARERLRQQR